MKNVKSIVVAAALLLTTVGVFAGKSKFSPFILYYDVDGTQTSFQPLTTGFTSLQNLTTTSTGNTAVTITGAAQKDLYVTDNGGSKQRIYTNAF
jgi:hypothetical protein